MQNTSLTNSLQDKAQSSAVENEGWTRYHGSILLSLLGGLLCGFLGLLSLIVFPFLGGSGAAVSYIGISLLFLAFTFFGVSAHFMDKSDASKRRYKKLRAERFRENNKDTYS
jgi:hypothetical protein